MYYRLRLNINVRLVDVVVGGAQNKLNDVINHHHH